MKKKSVTNIQANKIVNLRDKGMGAPTNIRRRQIFTATTIVNAVRLIFGTRTPGSTIYVYAPGTDRHQLTVELM